MRFHFPALICGFGLLFNICSASAATGISLGDALDNTNLVWVTSTNYPWFGTNDVTYDGVDAAGSGNRFVADSTSWLQTTAVGPGELSFWWNVTSDDADFLEFDINGLAQDSISGSDVIWNYRVYSIPPGTNLLRWQYVKDAAFN